MSSGENGQADGDGRLLAGRYRVAEQLGRGGMGVVWRAVDELLGREVAVKELRTYTDAAAGELSDLQVRMQREARAAARVRHTGVVAVHDIADEGGRPLIVMELIDGPSLDDVLRERGTLAPGKAAAVGAEVLDALAAAHRAGVLHRDVKPGNILLERSGRVVLTDFGIAAMDDPGDGSTTHLTRSGELVGSLDYLAPERAQGHAPGPASDVWALGATLYAAVEGNSPFRRTSAWSTLAAIVVEPLPEPRRAGPLSGVLQQLLHKDPGSRPDAARAADLLRQVAVEALQARDAAPAPRDAAPAPGPGPRSRETTVRNVPGVPPGFGPPEAAGTPAQGFGPAGAYGDGGNGSGGYGEAGSGGGAAPGAGAAPGGSGAPGAGAAHAGGVWYGGGSASSGASGHPGGAAHGGNAVYGYGYPGAPGGPVTGAAPGGHGPGTPAAGQGPAVGPGGTGRPRRRGRAVLAATAVAAVLAATGIIFAVMSDGPAGTADTASASEAPGPSEAPTGHASRGTLPDAGGAKHPGKRHTTSPSARNKPARTRSAGPATRRPPARTTPPGPGNGGSGGSGGSSTGSAPQAPACQPARGGTYNCTVWRSATSYTASGSQAGVLNAGSNYFYCQRNLGRRETYGRWTNTWWARTDDDSGNTDVYVSDVYLQGGDNNRPVPGLPTC